jgi:hypothetical protein
LHKPFECGLQNLPTPSVIEPNHHRAVLSGKFFSKVYEGPFSGTGKWSKDFENILTTKGLKSTKMFTWYTTCPKYARKYGKNYVAIISQVGSIE